jgi:hypothetical protein
MSLEGILHSSQLPEAAKLIAKFAYPEDLVRRDPKARRFAAQDIADRIRSAEKLGLETWTYVKPDGSLRAVIYRDTGFGRWIGLKNAETLFFGMRDNDVHAKRWIVERVKRHFKENPKHCFHIYVPIEESSLQKKFMALGMSIDSQILVGKTALAREPLARHLAKKTGDALEENGLRIRDLKTLDEVRQIVALKKKVFYEEPARCWFGTRSAMLDGESKRFSEFLRLSPRARAKQGRFLVVLDERDRVRGYGGIYIETKNKVQRDRGNLDYCFSREIQGLGVGSLVYLELLNSLYKQKITLFRGHTSNPAILRLAKITKRWPVVSLLSRCPPRDKLIVAAEKRAR